MDYLLNFSIILFSLWIFYKLVLENTSWHSFKRVYLLCSVIVAAIIPLLVVRTVIIPVSDLSTQAFPEFQFTEATASDADFEMNRSLLLWVIYFLGVLVMSVRFWRNLYELRIKSSDKVVNYTPYQLVLRKMSIVPHSFLKRIYVSANHYASGDIPEVVLDHEKTHLEQRHSLDILFIELTMIVFWFNPLIYLLKFSIKLNHEFLADRAVLEQYQDTQTYQKTLLSYTAKHHTRTIASTFNFPIIKKRFTIMNTQTTNTSGWLRSLALIPLVTVLVISCGQEEIIEEQKNSEIIEVVEDAQKEQNQKLKEQYEIIETIENLTAEHIATYNRLAKEHAAAIEYKGHSIYFKNKTSQMQTIWNSMNAEQRNDAEPWPYLGIDGNKAGEIAPPPPPPPPAPEIIEVLPDPLRGAPISKNTKLLYKANDQLSYDIRSERYFNSDMSALKQKYGNNLIKILGVIESNGNLYYTGNNSSGQIYLNQYFEKVDLRDQTDGKLSIRKINILPPPPPPPASPKK